MNSRILKKPKPKQKTKPKENKAFDIKRRWQLGELKGQHYPLEI